MSTSLSGLSSNFFPSPQNGFTTTLASTISAGATTVPLNSVAGYTNGQVATFVVDPTDTTKKQAFTGVIDTAGVQVTSVVWTAGTNTTHSGGATVVDYATATHLGMISKGILIGHEQTGIHKSGATYPSPTFSGTATGTYTLAGTPTISGATLSGTTTTSSLTSTDHLALNAGTSKLVKSTVLRQDDTTNAYQVGNTVTLTGWGKVVAGASNNVTATVTFGVTFLAKPIVLLTNGGDAVSATTYGSGGATVNIFTAQAGAITTTSFLFNGRSTGAAWSAGNVVFFQWMAIGEI